MQEKYAETQEKKWLDICQATKKQPIIYLRILLWL